MSGMRLDKYLAEMGAGSRSDLKKAVRAGRVTVNGSVLKDPAAHVQADDEVRLDGEPVAYEEYVYYMLHKPAGVISATEDKRQQTVLDLIDERQRKGLFPVGRLDYDSCGLLLLTNDGELANKISRPSSHLEKTYLARLNGTPTDRQLRMLRSGVEIDLEEKDPATGKRYTRKYKTRPASVTMVSQAARECVLEIRISEGKNRQIRKMAEAIGLRVLALQRTAIGEIKLGRTKEGGYRKLTQAEMEYLKKL